MARKFTILESVSIGNVDGTDSKNCTVRALSNCADMNIVEAKNLLTKHGRKVHEGCSFDVYEKAYHEAGLEFVGFFGTTTASCRRQGISAINANANRYKGMTLETFCKTFNRGSYAVVVKGHVLCVKGGKIVDTAHAKGNVSVCAAWKKPSVVKG